MLGTSSLGSTPLATGAAAPRGRVLARWLRRARAARLARGRALRLARRPGWRVERVPARATHALQRLPALAHRLLRIDP